MQTSLSLDRTDLPPSAQRFSWWLWELVSSILVPQPVAHLSPCAARFAAASASEIWRGGSRSASGTLPLPRGGFGTLPTLPTPPTLFFFGQPLWTQASCVPT